MTSAKNNGKRICISGGNGISIANGEIRVNGKKVNQIGEHYTVIVEGNVGTLACDSSVEVQGNVENLEADGSVRVKGDCGKLQADGSVHIDGNLNGNAHVEGSFHVRTNNGTVTRA